MRALRTRKLISTAKFQKISPKLCFIGYTLMENRSGLIVDTRRTSANGPVERISALSMIEPRADRPKVISACADKAYDLENFVNELEAMNVRAHVAQNTNGRRSGKKVVH